MERPRGSSGKNKDKSPGVHVALLRGVNVGGKNKLPMAELAAMFVKAGCSDVRTYIQSGNVVFGTADAHELCGRVSAEIQRRFGFEGRIVVRSAVEMLAVVVGNPLLTGADPKSLYVGFLAEQPAAARVRGLDPERSPGDFFAVVGREIFMRLGTGAAETRLTNAWFDGSLGTFSTFRNWRTVQRLAAMAAGDETGG